MKVIDIEWIGNKNLPKEVEVPDGYNISEIYNWLIERYDCDIDSYCVSDGERFSIIMVEPY